MLTVDRAKNEVQLWSAPSALVWEAFSFGAEQAAQILADVYNISADQAQSDFEPLLRLWNKTEVFRPGPSRRLNHKPPLQNRKRYYSIMGTCFALEVPKALDLSFHKLWSNLETEPQAEATVLHCDCDETGGGSLFMNRILKIEDAPQHVLLGGLMQTIVECLHPAIRWSAFIHAAAVCSGGKAAIFAAASGSGKSTLTAYLTSRGFDYLSDDIVPFAYRQHVIAPLPLPIGAKPGAIRALIEFFPLLQTDTNHSQHIFLNADFSGPMPKAVALVFPRYEAGAKLKLEMIGPSEALRRLLEDRIHFGFPVDIEKVTDFIDWLESAQRVVLTYSRFEDAEICIREILKS